MAGSGQLETQALLRDGTLAGSWTLDPARTEILLKTRHTWGLRSLTGVFRQVRGTGTVSSAGRVTGTVDVTADSIDTKNKQRDKHLRSADFFDVANHPDITVAVEGVSAADDGTARITGTLTVRGRTRPLDFDVRVAAADDEVRLDGEVEVNRADFGLTWNFFGMAALRSTIVVHAVFTPA